MGLRHCGRLPISRFLDPSQLARHRKRRRKSPTPSWSWHSVPSPPYGIDGSSSRVVRAPPAGVPVLVRHVPMLRRSRGSQRRSDSWPRWRSSSSTSVRGQRDRSLNPITPRSYFAIRRVATCRVLLAAARDDLGLAVSVLNLGHDAISWSAQVMDELIVVGEELPPVVAPGRYQAVAVAYRQAKIHGALKIIVDFKVTVPRPDGEGTVEVRLSAYYNASGGRGRVRAGASSKLYRNLALVTGRRPHRKGVPLGALIGPLLEVEVRTVTHDHRQRRLPLAAQYSVVTGIVDVIAGGRPAALRSGTIPAASPTPTPSPSPAPPPTSPK